MLVDKNVFVEGCIEWLGAMIHEQRCLKNISLKECAEKFGLSEDEFDKFEVGIVSDSVDVDLLIRIAQHFDEKIVFGLED